jgi:hypothetical protein
VYELAGLPGLALLVPVAVVVIMASVFAACRRRSSILISCLVSAVTFLAMSGSISLRPHLVSFALLPLVVSAWMTSAEDLRPRWWLVPLTWAWACSHGFWIVGWSVGVFAVVGVGLSGVRGRALLRLAAVPLASLAAAAFTPTGPELLLAPARVNTITSFIAEWQPPALGDPQTIACLALVGVGIAVWLRKPERIPWPTLVLLGMSALLAVAYARTLPLSAAISAPLAAQALQTVVPVAREVGSRLEIAAVAFMGGAAVLACALLAPGLAGTPAYVPEGLNPQLSALPAKSVVCNDYGLGGWLLWRHPHLRPMIDGRSEAYEPEHIADYLLFQSARPGWERISDDLACSVALVATDSAIALALEKQAGWRPVATDRGFVLLSR